MTGNTEALPGEAGLKVSVNRYWYPLLSMVKRDFKTRYAPTALGIGWAVLRPLLLLLLYTFVFSVIFKVKFRAGQTESGFVLYFASGFLPYLAMAEGIEKGCSSLTENRSLLDKVLFPAEVLPAVGVLTAAVTELIGLGLITIFACFFGIRPSGWLLLIPLFVVLRVIFTTGIAWAVSIINVFFSDLGQILGLLLMAWMFLTPIFYPVTAIPEGMTWILHVNPLYCVVHAYRTIILEAGNPLGTVPPLLAWAAITAVGGLLFFRKTVERAKDVL